MPDALSPAAAHQQDFLPLLAAGAEREAAGRREQEHGPARGRGGPGEEAGRGSQAGCGGGARGGGPPPCPPRPRPLPGAARKRPDATAAQRRGGPATPLRPLLAVLLNPRPPPTKCSPPHGACAEPFASRSRLRAGAGGGRWGGGRALGRGAGGRGLGAGRLSQ